MRSKKVGIVLWVACLSVAIGLMRAHAQVPVVLENESQVLRLDSGTDILVDSTNSLTIHNVQESRFTPNRGTLKFGYTKHNIWLRVTLKNSSPTTTWYLEIPAPFLEYVDFYQQDSAGWGQLQSGYYRPQSVRKVPHTGHVFPLEFKADSTATAYILISGTSPKTFPLFVISKEAFHNQVRLQDVGYGMFFGILIIMFFYNMIIYLTLRQINYLLYICTIVCTFLIFASASGYAGKFLWPETPQLNFYAGRMSLSALALFLAPFTYRFLEVPRYSPMMARALLTLIPLAILAAILIATGLLPSAGNHLITISIITWLSAGIVCRIKGNRNANFFIAAWTVYFVGGLLLTLRNSGVLGFTFWTTHFAEIGAALETTLIAFALAYQYRAMKQAQEDAQARMLTLQQQTNDQLELKVAERTTQLSRANEELTTTLETVQEQSKLIEAKNAELDGFFYRVSHDLKGPISSMQGLYNLAKLEVKDPTGLMFLDRKHEQVQRLNDIISGLIELTKLQGSALTLQKVDFNKLVNECLATYSGNEKFQAIEIRKHIDLNLEFHSEWTLINAIVQNLIENAIKYSGRKNPFVQIRIEKVPDGLQISVKDNGNGISAEHQAKIFEMFYRATSDEPGSGLGLYILKRSVDRLKGTVEVKSEPGLGTEFLVKLPEMQL